MQLEITRELLQYTYDYTAKLDVNEKYPLDMKVIYEPTAYLFDAETFLICDNGSDESDYLGDTIPFPIVNQHEAMHAFVDSINNKRITDICPMKISEKYSGECLMMAVKTSALITGLKNITDTASS